MFAPEGISGTAPNHGAIDGPSAKLRREFSENRAPGKKFFGAWSAHACRDSGGNRKVEPPGGVSMRKEYELDRYDKEILALLEEDARRTNSDIARLVGLSPATVGERIARLRDVGVIQRFSIKIDPARLGYSVAAIVEFEPNSRYDDNSVRAVAEHPAVRSCYKVTGKALLILLVRVRDSTELNSALLEFNRFGQTHTSVILSSELEDRPWFTDDWGNPMEALLRRSRGW